MNDSSSVTAAQAGQIDIGGDLTVNRLGYGAMRITGKGIWGDPPDREQAKAVLRRAVELGVNFIDTADSYGPDVSENLIAEALHPVVQRAEIDGLPSEDNGAQLQIGPHARDDASQLLKGGRRLIQDRNAMTHQPVTQIGRRPRDLVRQHD